MTDATLVELRRALLGFQVELRGTVAADFLCGTLDHLEWAQHRAGERHPAAWYVGRAKHDLRLLGRSVARECEATRQRAFALADLAEEVERRI